MIFSKRRSKKICNGLTAKEFRCRCAYEACRAVIVDDIFINAFDTFRLFIELPLHVLSGHRCTQHNYDVKGKPQSRHLMGQAVDIAAPNLLEIFTVQQVIKIARGAGFTFIKYYPKKKFFHMDSRVI